MTAYMQDAAAYRLALAVLSEADAPELTAQPRLALAA